MPLILVVDDDAPVLATDALGDEAHTLRHDDRRGHLGYVIAERDGVGRRVRDDYVGLGYFLHHALCGHLSLELADAPLDLRVAFHFFALLLRLLRRHHQVALALPELIAKVRDAQHQHRQRDAPPHAINNCAHRGRQGPGEHAHQRDEFLPLVAQEQVHHEGDDTELGQRFHELDR